MRLATFDCDHNSFLYYYFHVLDTDTGQYLYEEELVDPSLSDIAQGLISLLDKSVELGADVDGIVYEELEAIVDSIARDLNTEAGKVTLTIKRATGGDVYDHPAPHTFVLQDAATDVE